MSVHMPEPKSPHIEPSPSLETSRAEHELAHTIAALGPWFHNLHLNGQQTAPRHFLGDYPAVFFERFAQVLPADLRGWRVLDVGCNAGFYSFEMKRRGAAQVVGLEVEPLYVRQARFAAAQLGMSSDIDFREGSVYDVAALDGPFDLVLFLGVFYHLRHPLLALDLLRHHAVGRLLLFQTMIRGTADPVRVFPDYAFDDHESLQAPGFPRLAFVEHRYAGDASNWWIPNRACAEALLRDAGFEILANPHHEVFLCRPAPLGASVEHLPRPWQAAAPQSRS
jgi:tRNA (mo5U34)-methyltransferase